MKFYVSLERLERSRKLLTLHLVGNFGKAEALRAKRDSRIVVHGHLDREKLEMFYQDAMMACPVLPWIAKEC